MEEKDCNSCCSCDHETQAPEYEFKWKAIATAAAFAGACGIEYFAGTGGIVVAVISLLAIW